jgi:ribosomal protein L24E
MLSSEDKIEALLKRYADLAEEEHAELFWKPPITTDNRFICCYCGKLKIVHTSGVRFHRLDKITLYFCNSKCWVHWLKQNPKVTWKLDPTMFGKGKSYRNPVETRNTPVPISES